ncbi:MAG: hypothetical protein L3V56_02590 [Candidatus Magnetoovum sp. WYHC-5]|nr:hypothetical protein [Candidatus Magnetoovum sp. WYHC-5]
MALITIPPELDDKLGEKGADAFVKVINEAYADFKKDLATKEDLLRVEAKLDSKIDRVEAKLKEELLKVEHRLESRIDRLEAKLEGKIERLDAKIDRLDVKFGDRLTAEMGKANDRMTIMEGEIKLQKWMLGILLAGVLSLIMKAFFT